MERLIGYLPTPTRATEGDLAGYESRMTDAQVYRNDETGGVRLVYNKGTRFLYFTAAEQSALLRILSHQ